MASAQVRRQLQVAELDRSSSNSVVQWPACPSQTIASPPFRDASYADLPHLLGRLSDGGIDVVPRLLLELQETKDIAHSFFSTFPTQGLGTQWLCAL